MIVHNSYYGAKTFENGEIHKITLTLVEDMHTFFTIKHGHMIGKDLESDYFYIDENSIKTSPIDAHTYFENEIEACHKQGYR